MTSIKFEIRKERNEELTTDREWSFDDMLASYNEKSCTNQELLKSFDSKEQAVEYFENEKKYCSSLLENASLNGYYTLNFDYLVLMESEYDEEDEFVQSTIIEEFVTPL